MIRFASVVIVGLTLAGCVEINYQSLETCANRLALYSVPEEGDPGAATIESIRFESLGTDDTWVALITHVECMAVPEPWEIVRIPAGHARVLAAFGKYRQQMNSAQWLEFDAEAGARYYLHVKPLTYWDMAFWIKDENGNVVASTERFEPKMAEG